MVVDEMQTELDKILNPKKKELNPEAREKLRAKRRKAAEAYKMAPKVVPGGAVVYVGRLPTGFEDAQVKEYFSQFGQISRMRMRRNPRTGASRHACFIEFRHAEVASIVVETMQNYLIKGRLMQCSLVAEDKVHPEMWKGANRKFHKHLGPKKMTSLAGEGIVQSKTAKRSTDTIASKPKSKLEVEYDFEPQSAATLLADLL